MESLGDILRRVTTKRTSQAGETPLESEPEPAVGEVCSHCGGTSWLRIEVPVGHPDFGKALACQCQQEVVTADRVTRLQRYSNLGYLTRLTFLNLDPSGRAMDLAERQQFHRTFEAAHAYAEAPQGWFVLAGPSGSGKTHLAAAIANRCLEQGRATYFMTVPDLLDHLRAAFAPTADVPYDELFDQVRNAPLLVLDDLGAHASTPWAHEKLYQVLNHRGGAQLPTVITVRGPLEDLDSYLKTRLSDPQLTQLHDLGTSRAPLLQHLGTLPEQQRKRQTFQSFDARGNNPDARGRESLEDALRAAQTFATSPDGWLVFAGPVGCGKTHLAVAIVNRCLEQDLPVFFTTVPDLLDYLREAFAPNADATYHSRFDQVRNASLLVLDDLGTQSATPWANEKLHQLIAHRHNARLPTIITTNRLAYEQTGDSSTGNRDQLSEPISSRLKDASMVRLVVIAAPDYRDKAKRSNSPRGRTRPSADWR